MNTKLNQTSIEKLAAEKIDAIGTRWTKKGDRLYLSDEFKLAALGLEVERYRGGAISSATQNGEKISNSKASKLLDSCRRAWINLETGELMDVTRSEAEELLVKAIDEVVSEKEAAEKEAAEKEAAEEVVAEYVDIVSNEMVEIVEKEGLFYVKYEGEELDGPLHVKDQLLTREFITSLKSVRPFNDGKFVLPSKRLRDVLECESDAELDAFMKVFSVELAAADAAAIETIRQLGRDRIASRWNDFLARSTRDFPNETYETRIQNFSKSFGKIYFLTDAEIENLLK